MKRRVVQSGMVFLIAIIVSIFLVNGFEFWLDEKIASEYKDANYSNLFKSYSEDMNKGQVALNGSANNDDVLLMGSSELYAAVDQNPKNMFPNKELPNDISLIGRPYTQSLLHAMKIGTVDLSSKSKIAIVVSLQWFWGNEIDQAGFAANFSKLQFYDAIKDSSMTKDTKDYICNRIYSVLSNTDGFEDIKLFAYMNSHDGILSKAGKLILAPYYSIDQKLLNLKDKWETYQALKATEVSKAAIRDINWKEQTQIATAQGKKNCTNNPFYVDDNYYNEYLKSQIETLRSSSQTEKLISSELTDYEFFLKICKQKGIKPYIILMCTNGRYYDYIGIDKETRGNLYNRLEKVAESYGMEVLNLSDKEYEPYFMKDGMHLGWKGWLYVNRKICEHFAKTEK